MPRTLRLTRALVEKIPAKIPDPGPIVEIAALQTDEVRARMVREVLAGRPDPTQFWVFAFGSLMWRLDVPFVEQRRARVHGWRRAFCLGPDTRYRGNPDHPGLMLSLEPGGSCEGVAFRLGETDLSGTLTRVFEREPPIPPEWVRGETSKGDISAIAFVSRPGPFGIVAAKSPEEIARQIAPAVGMFGSMADYVFNTASQLEEMGIDDPLIWQMQDLVAAELERLPPR